ncbi:MAG: DEAD/DEAH box helicase [Candidatus Micrarchaeota archaeon]
MQLVPRAYQLSIYNSIMQHGNTLVVLPTGLGKTLIALMLIKDKMKLGRCLFLTPTKPLAKQHYHSVMKTLELSEKNVALISGEVAPKKRKEMYLTDIIISTPQTIKNDLEKGILEPIFSLVIFDECHRSIGNYAYTYVSDKLHDVNDPKKTLFIGLTASPGGRMDRIKEVMDTLKIDNVEIRDQNDSDVAPYVQKNIVSWIPIELSEHFKDIRKELEGLTSKYAQRLAGMGFPPPLKHKGKFMALRQRILDIPHNIKYPALIQYSVLLHLLHMTELLETQGLYPLRGYLEKLGEKDTKSAKLLLNEPSLDKVKKLCEDDEDHPKMKVLVDVIKKLGGKKIIVFVQYRAQISRIEEVLKQNGITAKQFVGKKDGVTKKIQEETIAEFREGKFDVMVASSVHHNEYIIIRNDKTKEIRLEKIGEFVDKYIKEDVVGTASKKIDGFSTLSYDEDKVDFFSVTHVHKHERISRVVRAKTRSGFNALITEDHSLFSFNRKGRLISTIPQKINSSK